MTIALALKVHDGMVLATDSASTISFADKDGNEIKEKLVHNSANKLFNLVKGLPIGGMTWGSGSIGSASISTLMKDFRKLVTDPSGSNHEWHVDPKNYRIDDVAQKLKRFFEHAVGKAGAQGHRVSLGFLVSGYTAGEGLAEGWQIDVDKGVVRDPVPHITVGAEQAISAFGQPESFCRLVLGFSLSGLPAALTAKGVKPEELADWVKTVQEHSEVGMAVAPMPIQDAVDLAEFLVYVATQYQRYTPGPPTVGGPIDVAAITKHEGFKWVKRKHYYEKKLNPPLPGGTPC